MTDNDQPPAQPPRDVTAAESEAHIPDPQSTGQSASESSQTASHGGKRLTILTLTALGVVFGDIGTSPLYAIKECFSPLYGISPTRENVFGILSMIVWALTLVITVKYVSFVLRADNRGEGGTFAMLALIFPHGTPNGIAKGGIFVFLALFGTALLYGDGIITPAMTVLGAMEGLEIAVPGLSHFIVPFSLIVLTSLFVIQRFGTDVIGKAFGPVMLIWFLSIGAMGLVEVVESPWILAAVNPIYALHFVREHETLAFFVLGSVVLVLTGGEALYADMGHFGRRPIRIAWLFLVFPALLLNYFGQGALLVRTPGATENPFFLLAPKAVLIPLLLLATAAAVIASQSMISGAYSVTRQGIALGFIPRMEIRHTSDREEGQIYIPEVNWFIAIGCLLIVIGFRGTSALGAAYGIAVTGAMLITSILFYMVARIRFGWKRWQAAALCTLFLIMDTLFFSANLAKFKHGGWVPIVLGILLFTLMITWKRGRMLLMQRLAEGAMPIGLFLDGVAQSKVYRVPGTAVFMTGNHDGVPPVLLHHLKHNKVLHERVLLVSVVTADVPETNADERIRVLPLGHGFWRVIASYGFMQTPNVPQILEVIDQMGIRCKPMETSYFLGRERLIPVSNRSGDRASLARWRKVVFSIMARNARSATDFFNIPPNRVVELGTQIEF